MTTVEGEEYITWKEVEKAYGKKFSRMMLTTKYLDGITVIKREDGEILIPMRDIKLAERAAKGERIHPEEWD